MPIGKMKFIAGSGGPMGTNLIGYKPVFDMRNLPKELENHINLNNCVQVLVNCIGQKTWINVNRSDIFLDNAPKY